MTYEQLRKHWPNASIGFLKANCDKTSCAPPGAKPQPPVRHEPVATKEGKESNSGMVLQRVVRITSYRRRLLDPDNLAGGCKYFLDCCKYSQLIPDDRPQDIILEVRQEKVKSKNQERTEIEIFL